MMMDQVWEMMANCTLQFFNLVSRLYSYYSLDALVMVVFVIFLSYRFLLRPLIGGSAGGSDRARKSSKGNSVDTDGGDVDG